MTEQDTTRGDGAGEIVRGGGPGTYFFYRPDEVLIAYTDIAKAVKVLGEREDVRLPDERRSDQLRAKRDNDKHPFGVSVFHFGGTDRAGNELSVPEALRALDQAKERVEAHYNYVTSRSPMRSHAVSYAEPADVTKVWPNLARSEPSEPSEPSAPTVLVGVLDTGRPRYDAAFRAYYARRYEEASGGGTPTKRGLKTTNPLDAMDAIFASLGDRSLKPFAKSTSSDRPVYDDEDTMVTPFGRLAHPHAGHGIFVSSIIARHAPRVKIVAEATMSHDAIGDEYDMLVDLDHAVHVGGCKLLNMSLGFHTEEDKRPRFLTEALDNLPEGVLLVASAGNDGAERPTWPAAHPDVVAVAATDRTGAPTDWSNYGDDWVNVCAFGDDVLSDYVFADWDFPDGTAKRFRGAARWSGTSFAAPLVTAMIAREMKGNGDSARAAWERLRNGPDSHTEDENRKAIPSAYGPRLGPLPT